MTIKTILNRGLMILHPEWFKPKLGRLIITENCPLKCQMCTFWRKKSIDPTLKLIKHWIKECADFGMNDISLGGGEPFIRKDLNEIVDEVHNYGMTCGITTSGWLLDKVDFPQVDRCEVSIDGATPQIHDKIRGREGSWLKAISTVKLIKKLNLCEITQVNFCLQPDNYHELREMCKLAKTLDVGVSIIPVSLQLAAQDSISENINDIKPSDMWRMIEFAMMKEDNILNSKVFFDDVFPKMIGQYHKEKCLAPYIGLLIFANGDIYPCGNFDIPCGRLTEDAHLNELYEDYKSVRKEICSGKHEFCNESCTYPDIIPGDLKSNIKLFLEKY